MLWQTITPAFFYLTPIVWDINMLPEGKMRLITTLNPIYHFIAGFRSALYTGTWISLNDVIIISSLGIGLLLIGYRAFSKLEKGFYSHY